MVDYLNIPFMLVEDNIRERRIIERTLEDAGYSLIVPTNYSEARRILKNHTEIKLLITDLNLSDWICDHTGLDLIHYTIEKRPDIRIAILSAFAYAPEYYENYMENQGLRDVLLLPKVSGSIVNQIRQIEKFFFDSIEEKNIEIIAGPFSYNPYSCIVRYGNLECKISHAKHIIVKYLFENNGIIRTEDEILRYYNDTRGIWDYDSNDTRTIRTQICEINKEAKKAFGIKLIKYDTMGRRINTELEL